MRFVAQLYIEPQNVSVTKKLSELCLLISFVLNLLGIQIEEVDAQAIKKENKTIRHEIFDFQDEFKRLEEEVSYMNSKRKTFG